MNTTTQSIALNKLTAWNGNVRKTNGADTALAELAASIDAHGLINPLTVRPAKKGRYEVVAGKRRLLALLSLAAAGTVKPHAPIPCHVLEDSADATEISLAENALREQMHPADEFEAFRKLADNGMSLTDIAARFGVTERTVQQRLKLARVSPVILDAYRQDELSLEVVMAFAVSDDHEAQERLWQGAPGWMQCNPRSIRSALTGDEITGADPRVRFVTLKAYEKAGGAVRRDLFSEGHDGVFILDAELLNRLAAKKLERVAKAVRKEGWQWVDTAPAFDYETRSTFGRRYAEDVPLTAEQAAELAALEQEADAFYDIEGEPDEAQHARFEEISTRIDALNERAEIWPPETLAIAGAVVTIDRSGEAEIIRGLVRPDDEPPGEEEESHEETASPPRPVFPAALVQDLTEQRTAALAAALCDRPDVALAAVVHGLALDIFYERSGHTCLEISGTAQRLKGAAHSKAAGELERRCETWGGQLPGHAEDFWAWCLEADNAVLLDVLAFCAARTVNAVLVKGQSPDSAGMKHAAALAAALQFDIGAWFTPTAGNYFSRVTKPQILAAIEEAKGVPPAPAWASMKKADLAALAEREIEKHPWLPEPLR